MRDFKNGSDGGRSGSFGGGGDRVGRRSSFGRSSSFGGRDSVDRPTMYTTTCSECRQSCEVPFRPMGSKPVYCKSCFDNKGGANQEGMGRRDLGRRNFSHRDELKFTPKFGKKNSDGNEAIKKQLDEMNSKLDALIKLLGAKK